MNVASFKIKISQGTGAVLGLNSIKNLVNPTTAYVMLGSKCQNNCEFCSQSEDETRLSRVMWPEFSVEEFVNSFNEKGENLVNICIQVTRSKESADLTLSVVKYLKKNIIRNVNINVSIDLLDYPQLMDDFFEAGVGRIGISIDVASEKEFFYIKHKDFNKNLDFLFSCAEKYPGRISTHIIVGIGETGYELFSTIKEFIDKKINVSLFSFTPVKKNGYLKDLSSPDIEYYRLCQSIFYLMKKNIIDIQNIKFSSQGEISGVLYEDFPGKLKDGEFFRTSGCSGCNRPFYNEKVTGNWYNFPRSPQKDEIIKELERIKGFYSV